MQNLSFVQVEQGQRHLGQPVDDLTLREVLTLGLLDPRVDISSIAVDHDQVQILVSVHVGILVGDNICVADLLEQTHFILSIF
jgi:hypothetical protein